MIDIGETESQTWIIEMINNVLIEVPTSLAEQERANIRERQAQGLAQMPINPKTGKQRSFKTGCDIGRSTAGYSHNLERSIYRVESKEDNSSWSHEAGRIKEEYLLQSGKEV